MALEARIRRESIVDIIARKIFQRAFYEKYLHTKHVVEVSLLDDFSNALFAYFMAFSILPSLLYFTALS